MAVVAVAPHLRAQDPDRSTPGCCLTFLVNEGFLVQVDGKSVLIDAFVRDAYYGYGALPETTYQQLLRAEPPFHDVSLALTSHVHLDHFQTEPAVLFLQKHSRAVLMSGEEVVVAVRDAKLEPAVADQTRILWPDAGQVQTLEHQGVRVHGFRLRHTGARNRDVQNLGVVVELGDTRILHVGDAEPTAENFQPYDLPARKIDLAILPVWMFADRPFVDRHIGARRYVAAHIPVDDLARTKRELGETQPDVIVLEQPLETWTEPQ